MLKTEGTGIVAALRYCSDLLALGLEEFEWKHDSVKARLNNNGSDASEDAAVNSIGQLQDMDVSILTL